MDLCGGYGPQQHPDAEQEKRKLGLEDADSTHSFFFCCPKSQPGERGELQAAVLCACACVRFVLLSFLLLICPRSSASDERERERGTVGSNEMRHKVKVLP
jgi:hypothetical protein